MNVGRKGLVAGAAMMVSACTGGMNIDMSTGPMVGALVGGAAGGFAGYQFGGGVGQLIYASMGALGGAAAGYEAGRRLWPSDRAAYGSAVADALDGNGEHVGWRNPDTGNSGIVRAGDGFEAADGSPCRTFRATVVFSDEIVSGPGAACRDRQGGWRLAADAFG